MFKNFTAAMLFVLLALAVNHTVFSQSVSLDDAIAKAAAEIAASVPQGTKIAVINITSDSERLSDYIITELNASLIDKKVVRVVPRTTVELQAANKEFSFQMSGYVSDADQKRLGRFLEAATIVTGSVTQLSLDNYRLVISAIELESFTYQASYRSNLQYDAHFQGLIAKSGSSIQGDYTIGERIGTAALNTFFGLGSLNNGDDAGKAVLALEALAIVPFMVGAFAFDPNRTLHLRDYDSTKSLQTGFFIGGGVSIGLALLIGYIIPFFHHKPGARLSQAEYPPLQLELVSTDRQGINGLKLSYNLRF